MGLSDTAVRSYLDRMADAFVMRQLQPWHENPSKRQVRAPEVYVRDSGLLTEFYVLHAGETVFPLSEDIRAIPLYDTSSRPSPLR